MTITLQAVNELIASLESADELSIREQKFLKLAKAYQQLAAENLALKQFPEQIVKFIGGLGSSAIGIDTKETIGLAAIRIKTPATDRIVAGIKADGMEEFIGRLQQHVDEGDFIGDEVAVIVGAIDCGKEFCEQLREGADK
ncbi:hypothetical protein [Klebsiella pneumoniae]|uniref:hypothetical protein n=1 Tax=Klebsiella pneumoniae TaxID=573 RepID=UPI003871AAD8